MSSPHRLRIGKSPLTVALLATALLTSLTACLPADSFPSPSADSEATSADTSPEALRAYYESRLALLRETLLDERQEEYISRRHYEARIAELESRLSSAEDQDSAPAPDGHEVAVSLSPAEEETEPPLPTATFRYTARGDTVSIDAYAGTAKDVAIPDHITNIPVTRIGDDAFRGAPITTVTIPDSVTEIGWFSFADCPRLRSITLPASVTSIAYGAFDGCPRLTLICPRDSYAARYAESFGLAYEIAP